MLKHNHFLTKFTHNLHWLLAICCALVLFAGIPVSALAQSASNDTTENIEMEVPADSLGRRTPRGTVSGFINAVAEQNYTRAARYLDIPPTIRSNERRARLAQGLQRLLDQDGDIVPYSWISNDPAGSVDDNLGPEQDRVGTASAGGVNFDVVVERLEDSDGNPVWLFSSETVQRIPAQAGEVTATLVDRLLPAFLLQNTWSGVPVGHWIAMLVLAVLVYLLAWIIVAVTIFIIRRLWAIPDDDPKLGVIKAFGLPIRLYLTVLILVAASQAVGISIVVRQRFSEVAVIVGLVAVLLLLWRLVDAIARVVQRRLTQRGNLGAFSAVLFLQRASKIALLVFGGITILSTLGFDVTTGLAALGIGGIALALGAQKTVENFVGSVTLIADQPVRVGDFCKVGDTVGTVERIGMRSTRIRTNDRTIVTIPNGEFSSLRIENYAHRDRFWFHPILGLRYETTPDQIRFLLVELRAVLYAHPKIDTTTARVRFIEMGADSLKVEVFTYILASSFDEFLEVKEDLYLRFMDVVAASGTGFAFPSQTLYMARDTGISEEKTREAEEKVQQWREAGELQIPAFDAKRIESLRNSITYPPEGSVKQANDKQ